MTDTEKLLLIVTCCPDMVHQVMQVATVGTVKVRWACPRCKRAGIYIPPGWDEEEEKGYE